MWRSYWWNNATGCLSFGAKGIYCWSCSWVDFGVTALPVEPKYPSYSRWNVIFWCWYGGPSRKGFLELDDDENTSKNFFLAFENSIISSLKSLPNKEPFFFTNGSLFSLKVDETWFKFIMKPNTFFLRVSRFLFVSLSPCFVLLCHRTAQPGPMHTTVSITDPVFHKIYVAVSLVLHLAQAQAFLLFFKRSTR